MPGEPLGLMDDPRESREVERDLVYASVAKELDRPYEEELGQAIGSRALTSHRRERHRRPAVRRRKLQERAHDARRVACDHDDRVTLLVRAELVERHGEAAFRFALSPFRRHALELGERRLVERRDALELDDESGLLQP